MLFTAPIFILNSQGNLEKVGEKLEVIAFTRKTDIEMIVFQYTSAVDGNVTLCSQLIVCTPCLTCYKCWD